MFLLHGYLEPFFGASACDVLLLWIYAMSYSMMVTLS